MKKSSLLENNRANTDQLLTLKQACVILNVHPDTLRRWEKNQQIASVRIGTRRDRRYKFSDILKLAGSNNSEEIVWQNDVTKKTDVAEIVNILATARCIFFDMSDTLMIPFPFRGEIYADIAYMFGYNLDPDLIEKNYIKQYDDWEKEKLFSDYSIFLPPEKRDKLFQRLHTNILLKAGVPPRKREVAEKIADTIYLEMRSNPNNWRTYPFVEEFLASLVKKQKYLAIVDNWDKHLHTFVEQSPIGKYISLVVSGGEIQRRKPDPAVFNLALERSGYKKHEVVYIGNRYIDDVMGARNAGIVPIIFDPARKYINEDFFCFYRYKDLIL